MTYFCVSDTDATVEQAQQLGGSVQREPWDTEYGRIAVLLGPLRRDVQRDGGAAAARGE